MPKARFSPMTQAFGPLHIFSSSCKAGPITLNWLKCLLYSRLSPFWRMSEQIRPSLGFVALPSRRKGAQCPPPPLSLALFSFSIRHSPSSSADQTDPFHRCKLTDRPPLALSMGPLLLLLFFRSSVFLFCSPSSSASAARFPPH